MESCRGSNSTFLGEQGQGTVEYLLILSFVIFSASQINKQLIGTIDRLVLRVGAQLEKDLKTGRDPLGVWSN
jgi:hypothetical protein